MKLKTRIVLGFTMIILMPLLLFAATLYGFSQSQAQKAQAVTESDGTVYDISITDSADSQGRVHVMAKDLFISAFVILISVALVVGLWVYRSIAVPLVKLKKATQNIKEGNLDFVLDVEGKDEFSELCQDFEEMRRRLKESTEEKSLIEKENRELISNISHQTKTPIANLLLYSELLLEEELPQQIEGNVSAIHEQTQKLKFLIESLVKLSRLENGILQLVPRMEKLQPMLERAVWELKQKAEEKGLQISLHNTDVEAYFDPKWTGEAIGNVIDNAIKYTEHGEICVSAISYEMFVRIDIADTGCGIREEELPKIFMRFYRSELVKDEEGVGIGLYLTREILQEQGGYIKVSSVYGQGSKFSIYLPKNNF